MAFVSKRGPIRWPGSGPADQETSLRDRSAFDWVRVADPQVAALGWHHGGQFGTAEEAKAMLLRAVAAVKADKAKALDMFNKGEGGFLDRDLYPFCSNISDGKILAVYNPNAKQIIGQDGRTLKDSTGKAFGLEQYAAANKPEGELTEVSYLFPKPGADPTPVPKVSFTTKVGDLICGVGYYK